MFHVFSADEEQLLRDWCVSLTAKKTPTISLLTAMNYVIDKLRQRQVGEPGHTVRLTGPDPESKKKDATRTESLHWWFEQGNRALMSALANPENGWIVPFDSIASPISSSLLAGNGDMAADFRSIVPDSGGATYGNVFAQWIDKGCPLDEVKTAMLMLRQPQEEPKQPVHRIYRRPNGKIWGMGTPH
jgi:hypothetical protein